MARVLGVIAASTNFGSIHQLSLKISTNTGLAPKCTIGATEAIQVLSGTITSSPFFIP